MKNKPILSKIILVIAALFIGFLIVEFCLRIMNYHPRFLDIDIFVEQDNSLLPYKLKPNYEGYQIGKYVKLDQEGNRVVVPNGDNIDDSSEIEKDTILILGDSVVFGYGLENDQTMASQLQRLVNENDSNYIVQNVGVPGYTSWNEYEALNQYLENNDVDMVILVYVFNDVMLENNGIVYMKGSQLAKYSPVKKYLYKNIYTLSLVKDIRSNFSTNSESKKLNRNKDPIIAQLYKTYLNEEALSYSMEAVSKIKALCDQKGIEFLVVIPRFHVWYYNYPEFSKDFETQIESRLSNAGVESFIATSHVDNLSVDEIDVLRNDHHPSALAIKYVVEEIYDKIDNGN